MHAVKIEMHYYKGVYVMTINLLVCLYYWNEFVMDLFEAHNQNNLKSYIQLSYICILSKDIF
jgi:hypothetical protein